MDEPELTRVVGQVGTLVEAHYVFPDVGSAVSRVLADGLAKGRYPADARSLATVVTADLQSVNGDKHLRLLYHEQALPERAPGDDTEEYAAMTHWAGLTCGGVACVQRLAGNVGYLDLHPVLFPATISGESITAAMTLLAGTDALIIDLRHCLGGEPAMTAFIISYLWDHEPAQLSGLRERSQLKQAWTLPYVPGGRFGRAKPVYVLTSAATFSGASSSATTCSNSAGPPSSASALAAAPTPGRDSPCTPTWRRPSPLPKQSTRRPAATGKAQASPPTSRRPPPRPETPPTGGPSRM